MGVSIDQMTNDGYFPTQKDHLHLLEGASKNICSNTTYYSREFHVLNSELPRSSHNVVLSDIFIDRHHP